MDKYLLEILKAVNTIIIPGLGALTITDKEKGEVMFMPYLKHDDGELSKYIAEKEGMELNDAVNLIAKYVREILSTLDKGESYDMYQFGSFIKNESGDIEFIVSSAEVTSMENEISEISVPTQEPESSDVIDAEFKAEVPEANVEEELPEITLEEEKNEILPEPEKEVEKPIDPIPEVDPEPEKEKVKPIIPVVTPEPSPERELNILEKEERAATQARLDKLKEDKNKPLKKKRGVGFYALIVFGLIIVSFSSYVIIDFEGASKLMPFLALEKVEMEEHGALAEMEEILGKSQEYSTKESDTSAQSMVSTEPETPVINEEPVIKEEPKEAVVEKQVTKVATSSSSGYHIIAGSFGNPENAEKFAAKLRNEGANASVIQENGLHKVSLGSYSTRDEAKSALNNLKISVQGFIHKVD